MDLIYTNQDMEDVGVLTGYELDLAFGADENNLECRVQSGNHCCESGSLLYMEGTEFGGIIDSIESETDTEEVIYRGRTWHGILNSKVIQPDDGQAYLTVSGDANTVIGSLLSRLALTDLFEVSSEVSGLTISNYKMNRYITGYDGILKMLDTVGGKLKMYFNGSKVVLYATARHDFTQDEEFDADLVAFNAKRNYKGVNHLICLGSGQLEERMVVHLYADTEGNISQTQTQFGLDEVCAIYEYSNVETVEELIQEGTDKLESIKAADEISIDFDVDSDVYDVGDIIGAVDNITGLTAYATIAKKIVTIVDGEISVRLSPDTAKAGSSYELGGGSGGGGLTAHASTHAAGGSDPLTPADIGAISKSGDTMTGDLIVNGEVGLSSSSTRSMYLECSPSGNVNIYNAPKGDFNNTARLHLKPETGGLDDIFYLAVTKNGSTKFYKLYGEHNKPTPDEIGAAPAGYGLGAVAIDISNTDIKDTALSGKWGLYRGYPVTGSPIDEWMTYELFPSFGDGTQGYATMVARALNNPRIFVANVSGTTMTDWTELYSEHYKPTPSDIGAVSKAGDTMTGTLNIVPTGQAAIGMKSSGDASDSWIYADSGYIEMMVREKSDGTTYRGLVVRDATRAATLVNALGFYDRVNSVTTHYNIFGQHNKPTGTYTGTGSSTSQTKTIGGIGKALLITSDYAVGIVTQHGALFGRVSSTTAAYDTFTDTEINFTDGVLTIKSTSSYFNGSSYTYTYQVL